MWATAALAAAAILVAWPARNRRARPWQIDTAAVRSRRPGLLWSRSRLAPLQAVPAVAVLAAAIGAVLSGPVAAVIGGAYGGLAAWLLLRRHRAAAAARARARRLDDLGALAAELRAGLPTPSIGIDSYRGSDRTGATSGDRLAALAAAARRLAEQTGAPLAELIERIEADARAMDRAVASAAAQAAGARATAWLLAGLPVGGIALGYAIGVDPLDVLLHTPIGAGCAIAAIALQLAGLAWAERLGGNRMRER